MTLQTLAQLGETLTGAGAVASIVYLAVEFRKNTHTVHALALQQVTNSFASIAFETARDPALVDLWMRAGRNFTTLGDLEQVQYSLLMLSVLRRAENVFVQDALHKLDDDLWSGIRQSIIEMVSTPGARACWEGIKTRVNPEFRAFVEAVAPAEVDTDRAATSCASADVRRH